MSRRRLGAMLLLAATSGPPACADDVVTVRGRLVDPEQFFFARQGVLRARSPFGPSGPCWDEPCDAASAFENSVVEGWVGSLEDPTLASPDSEDGAFEAKAIGDETYHFVVNPRSHSTHEVTVNGNPVSAGEGLQDVVLYCLGTFDTWDYNMMDLVDEHRTDGVALVAIMDDAPDPDSMPLQDPRGIDIRALDGSLLYWSFDFESPEWPGGLARPVFDVADIPEGFTWMGMVSVVEPTSDTVRIEVTDGGTGGGRPYTYEPLELPMGAGRSAFARMRPGG